MPHVTHIELENFRSFRKAACRLSPFTLVVGANNSGKSNLLAAISEWSAVQAAGGSALLHSSAHHQAEPNELIVLRMQRRDGATLSATFDPQQKGLISAKRLAISLADLGWRITEPIPIYRLQPEQIGTSEEDVEGSPTIHPNGFGISRVLEPLSSGTRKQRETFARIEREFSRCVPEVEAISLFSPEKGKRAVQVEQRGIPKPVPLSELSEGTRLVLAILTLVNQEPAPEMLLLEDIDRAVHPRLFERLVEFLRGLTRSGRVQIIATCHNPYLIDEFEEEPEAVVIVEKENGASTLSNMDERIAALLEDGKLELPLGEIWFSGLAGGVPQPRLPSVLAAAS